MKNTFRSVVIFCLSAVLCAACAAPSQKRALQNTQGQVAPLQTPSVLADAEDSALPPPTVTGDLTVPPAQDPSAKKRPADKIVRVLLADSQKTAEIKHSGRVYIYTQNLDKKYKHFEISGIDPKGVLLFKCKSLDDNNRCKDYLFRSLYCRAYPFVTEKIKLGGCETFEKCGYKIKINKKFNTYLKNNVK